MTIRRIEEEGRRTASAVCDQQKDRERRERDAAVCITSVAISRRAVKYIQ